MKRNVVEVVFSNGYGADMMGTDKRYAYFNVVRGLKAGDIVVVEVYNWLSVATVVDPDSQSNRATKWLVQKIDLEFVEKERQRLKELSEVKAGLNKLYASKLEERAYEEVLKGVPEAETLLARLRELEQ